MTSKSFDFNGTNIDNILFGDGGLDELSDITSAGAESVRLSEKFLKSYQFQSQCDVIFEKLMWNCCEVKDFLKFLTSNIF